MEVNGLVSAQPLLHGTKFTAAARRCCRISASLSKPHVEQVPLVNNPIPQPVLEKKLMTVSPSSILPWESGCLVPNESVGDVRASSGDVIAMKYLAEILTSKVYQVVSESPLELATNLSKRLGVNVWIKREDMQSAFSFKLRGAYNMMAKLPGEHLARGVICSSAGNHAQGVALSAQQLGCDAAIVMPVTTPKIKWESVERLGATVVLVGDSYDEAQEYAKRRANEEGLTFIHPFDHPDVIAGQGTIGMEIVKQMNDPIDSIFVPVGGGGLIAGIAAYLKRVSPNVKIIGVQPFEANGMALSLYYGERVMLDQVGVFADSVAVKVIGEETFRLCRELVDGIVLVNRDAICASIKDMFEEKRNILEPAGALSLAGAEAYCKYYGLSNASVVVVASGANMNFDRLRLVTELASVGRHQEAVLTTCLPKEPGSLKQFFKLVGSMNITEFKYRVNVDKKQDFVLYSITYNKDAEVAAVMQRMESCGLHTYNLTQNDLVKDHLRHLMGGRAADVGGEILCRFTFPERPGTVMKFLDTMSRRWSITLFHYRGHGEEGANVLVGFQVAKGEMDEFQKCAKSLGYAYKVETDNFAYQLLMH